MSEAVTPEAVEQLVQEVSSWYAEQLIMERRAGSPNAERLKLLRDGLAACAADQQALQDADENEVAEIAARYAARMKQLKGR
ncbi:hypothetical protein OOK58_58940 [Streptomyces sp. NBC_01728]|uniref:hypothetical protein n=1 Tax=unclassified Streptomyces TaxID=2593676 RepID=UPI0022564264|nr:MULTISPECIES: hypothetical protein [unclassified Streptomyces]MCX4462386.1 hypothetical protein [Streptomyces sp. NBC_01719]MCX4500816.1 hypothetical protein [Streptomyces sp. NBC_01728]